MMMFSNRFDTLVVTLFDPVVLGSTFCLELVTLYSTSCRISFTSFPLDATSVSRNLRAASSELRCLDLQLISPANSGIDHPVSGIRCHGYAPSFRACLIFWYIFSNSVPSLI